MIKNLKARVEKIPILRNLIVLLSGSSVAQAIGLLASPFLSRIYSPEDFGVLGAVMSIVGVSSVATTLQYEKALVLEGDNSKAHALQKLCWMLLLITTVLMAAAVLLLPISILSIDSEKSRATRALWVIAIFFLTGVFNLYSLKCNREKFYNTIAVASVSRRLSLVLIQLVFGLLVGHAFGLLLGNVVGLIVAILVLQFPIRKTAGSEKLSASVRGVALKYRHFPIYSLPQRVINSISAQLPVFVFGVYFSVEIVGAFWFAFRLLQLPATMVTQSVSSVFFRDAVDISDDMPNLKKLYLKFTSGLVLLILTPTLAVIIWGREMFVFIFGAQWGLAGDFSQGAMIWVAFTFINAPAMVLFTVFGKLKFNLCFDILLVTCRLAALIHFSWRSEPLYAIIAFSIVSVLFDSFAILYWWWRLNANPTLKLKS